MYHHLADEDTSSSTITPRLFREQLAYLQSKGHHFITLDDFKRFLDGAAVPDKAVLVTFDDGYESFYTLGFPVLQELQIPAVNFIITETLDHPHESLPGKMSREQLHAMTSASDLIDLACHTHAFHGKRQNNKAFLLQDSEETDLQYRDRIMGDAQICIDSVEAVTLAPVDALAYPFGIFDSRTVKALEQTGIQYAFTLQPLMTTRNVDHYRIPRINAGSPQISPAALYAQIHNKIVAVPN